MKDKYFRQIERLLHRVQKPARYMGHEMNLAVKRDPKLRIALSYPDLYEVGMSNNGIRILCDAVNRIDGVSCERVFAVERDFEEALRGEGVPLYTLESFTPLSETGAIGFNVSHELLAANILQILDLGGVPLTRRDRKEGDPLVIAGGGGISNPLPLFDFMDLFFIGDGEEGFVEIALVLLAGKEAGMARADLIASLAEIDGLLVPGGGGTALRRVYRGPMKDPERPIVPNMRIAQDRAVVEISRGCPNLCAFCHSGYYDLPYRAYGHREAGERALEILKNTGYDEVTLSSLSVSDYRALGGLLNMILPSLTERGISVSLPSLRVDTSTLPLIEILSEVRRTSLTFAVESGSEDMRRRANKSLSNSDLIDIVKHLKRRGWKMLKLYFMLGLPGCEEFDEAESIILLLRRILDATERRMELNVTLSPFVPKPHTPFQRRRQMDTPYFEEAVQRIKRGLPRKISVKNHDLQSSQLEGVIARGDSRLGPVILASYRDGCRLDSWTEFARFDIWRKNLDALLPGWESFLSARGGEEPLPWDIVDIGYRKVIARIAGRDACGPCTARKGGFDAEPDAEAVRAAMGRFRERYAVVARYRLKLSKTGMMKFISHMDFVEILKRGLRMAGAPVSFTQGFNKRERLSMGHPLQLGIESESELADIDLFAPLDQGFHELLSGKLPQGMEVLGGGYIEGKEPVMAVTEAAAYRIDFEDRKDADAAAARLASGEDFQEGLVPMDETVLGWSRHGESGLKVIMPVIGRKGMRIDALARALAGRDDIPGPGTRITRSALLRRKEGVLEPIL